MKTLGERRWNLICTILTDFLWVVKLVHSFWGVWCWGSFMIQRVCGKLIICSWFEFLSPGLICLLSSSNWVSFNSWCNFWMFHSESLLSHLGQIGDKASIWSQYACMCLPYHGWRGLIHDIQSHICIHILVSFSSFGGGRAESRISRPGGWLGRPRWVKTSILSWSVSSRPAHHQHRHCHDHHHHHGFLQLSYFPSSPSH